MKYRVLRMATRLWPLFLYSFCQFSRSKTKILPVSKVKKYTFPLCPEMQAVTKMADLTRFRQTDVGQSDEFYANYITRDGVNMLANLTNLAIFMQITSYLHLCPEMQAVTKMADLTRFRQTDVGQSDDFYANYITRDGVNMLANLTNLAIFMQITS